MEHRDTIRHEVRDAPVRPIVGVGAGLAVAALFTCLVAYGFLRFLENRPELPANPMAAEQQEFPPGPRIEEHPAIELRDLRQQEQQRLEGYGWVDREAGTVRIPVERAIDLQLERGFPTRKEAK